MWARDFRVVALAFLLWVGTLGVPRDEMSKSLLSTDLSSFFSYRYWRTDSNQHGLSDLIHVCAQRGELASCILLNNSCAKYYMHKLDCIPDLAQRDSVFYDF